MKTLDLHRAKISDFLSNNGPGDSEYDEFDKIVNSIDNESEGSDFREAISEVLDSDTLFGYTFKKPFGYAGDFILIEKIYSRHLSDDTNARKWDKFYHSHAATEAVRNRKSYFINKLEDLVVNGDGKEKHILILGCGPGTDVHEFFEKHKAATAKFDLLDIDPGAIDYASRKNARYLERITFTKANVMRFRTEKQYDLIWSAGLFDYLDDRLFVFLLKRFKNNVKDSGQIIIGNFSTNNPW